MTRRLRPFALAWILAAGLCSVTASAQTPAVPAPSAYQNKLVDLERRYTFWSLKENPTSATDAGIHTYDTLLADFSPQTQAAQMAQLRRFRAELVALQPPAGATAHERVDYLLVRANLEGDWWSRVVLRGLQRNPSVYEGECANGIFAIVKREYAADDVRMRDAIARMNACPRVLAQGRANLTETVARSRRSLRTTYATATRSTRRRWTFLPKTFRRTSGPN